MDIDTAVPKRLEQGRDFHTNEEPIRRRVCLLRLVCSCFFPLHRRLQPAACLIYCCCLVGRGRCCCPQKWTAASSTVRASSSSPAAGTAPTAPSSLPAARSTASPWRALTPTPAGRISRCVFWFWCMGGCRCCVSSVYTCLFLFIFYTTNPSLFTDKSPR